MDGRRSQRLPAPMGAERDLRALRGGLGRRDGRQRDQRACLLPAPPAAAAALPDSGGIRGRHRALPLERRTAGQAAGFEFVPNIGGADLGPDPLSARPPFTSGVLREFWARYGTGDGPPFTGWDWGRMIHQMDAVQGAGKTFLAVTYGYFSNTRLMRYARASFLVAWSGADGAFFYRPDAAVDPWAPDWAISIGRSCRAARRCRRRVASGLHGRGRGRESLDRSPGGPARGNLCHAGGHTCLDDLLPGRDGRRATRGDVIVAVGGGREGCRRAAGNRRARPSTSGSRSGPPRRAGGQASGGRRSVRSISVGRHRRGVARSGDDRPDRRVPPALRVGEARDGLPEFVFEVRAGPDDLVPHALGADRGQVHVRPRVRSDRETVQLLARSRSAERPIRAASSARVDASHENLRPPRSICDTTYRVAGRPRSRSSGHAMSATGCTRRRTSMRRVIRRFPAHRESLQWNHIDPRSSSQSR